MPYLDGSFPLVVHSGHARARRGGRPAGVLSGAPPGRLVGLQRPAADGPAHREPDGMPPVYHGDTKPPYRSLVHTDFGPDLWTMVLGAGFSDVTVVSLESPAGVAFSARKAR